MLGADGFHLALARVDGEPVGVAYGVRTSETGGESVGVFGVAVLPEARRRGIGAALTTHVVEWGLSTGADLAWLNPDTDAAVRLYSRMGFEETGGFDVYVDN
jgi:GNAT superfamily N-acetyltransferase